MHRPVTQTAAQRYCQEHKQPCEMCSKCKKYSFCPKCHKCLDCGNRKTS